MSSRLLRNVTRLQLCIRNLHEFDPVSLCCDDTVALVESAAEAAFDYCFYGSVGDDV